MLSEVINWLAEELNIPRNGIKLTALAGDASARRYYRCFLGDKSYVIMHQATVDHSFFQFIKLAKIMQSWGLSVPEIYKNNQEIPAISAEDVVTCKTSRDGGLLGGRIAILPPNCKCGLCSHAAFEPRKQFPLPSAGIAEETLVAQVAKPPKAGPGMLLLSDLGDELYLKALSLHEAVQVTTSAAGIAECITPDRLYAAAFDRLLVMQSMGSVKNVDRNFDTLAAKLTSELQLSIMDKSYIADRLQVFKTWFLQRHMQLAIDDKLEHTLAELVDLFTAVYADQPQVFVHLDYHSRNLLVLPDAYVNSVIGHNDDLAANARSPGIIDFQDAMFGPITYDLVSLLQDAYITWPRSKVEQWVAEYQQRAYASGFLLNLDFKHFIRVFDLVGVHRHLKNLGVFARLYHRYEKGQYLQHIPTLVNYILEACARYPELSPLKQLFEHDALADVRAAIPVAMEQSST